MNKSVSLVQTGKHLGRHVLKLGHVENGERNVKIIFLLDGKCICQFSNREVAI